MLAVSFLLYGLLFGGIIFDLVMPNYSWVLLGVISSFYVISCLDFYHRSLVRLNSKLLTWYRFFVYIFSGFTSVYLVREMDQGLYFIAWLFLTIWATDIMAYYGGKRFGSRQLSVFSPKKTIEGTVIGLLGSVLLVSLFWLQYGFSVYYILMTPLVSLLGQWGDLYESLIKRTYNIKDSSNALPGHGGFLDRADSTLYVFPLVYLLLEFLT